MSNWGVLESKESLLELQKAYFMGVPGRYFQMGLIIVNLGVLDMNKFGITGLDNLFYT